MRRNRAAGPVPRQICGECTVICRTLSMIVVVERRFRDIENGNSGLVFRFLYDREDPTRLHVEARWGVSPEQAIESFVTGMKRTIWIEQKRCFETTSTNHVVVWLWMDEARKRVLVITCVPGTASTRTS